MITVHHLNNSRSQRVLWLLEELGVPYEIKFYKRLPTLLAPPELKQVHPLGKSPVITEDGRTIAESGAIIEYLLAKYGNEKLKPAAGTEENIRFTYFMHFAEGTLMPQLVLKLIFSRISKPPVPFFIRPIAKMIEKGVNAKVIRPQLKASFDFLEDELKNRDWFAGNQFTAADIQMSFPIEVGEERVGYENRPSLRRFLERIRKMPSYKRALARAGGS